jgi:hypothetical protein
MVTAGVGFARAISLGGAQRCDRQCKVLKSCTPDSPFFANLAEYSARKI